MRAIRLALAAAVAGLSLHPASAQPLTKAALLVDPGNTKPSGQTFSYSLAYTCAGASGPCLNAEVDDLLPGEVQFVSTVPATPAGDVAAIQVTPDFGGSGRTRVQFVFVNPLPAGNSGTLLVSVRFPNGATPDGTVATNTADGVGLGAVPGTFTTPPVTVTAVASLQVTLAKTLLTPPAYLDMRESYRLQIEDADAPGALSLSAIGPVVDTLPSGTVFEGASPAADCEPGCLGTTPASLTWAAPCAVPLTPGNSCGVTVNVAFPSATFPSGTTVTNIFTADGTPLGLTPRALGTGQVTHSVTTFVPSPSASLTNGIAPGDPDPPTLNQPFRYALTLGDDGNVALDGMVVVDALPASLRVTSVTTGAYTLLSDFAPGEGARVSYEKNTAPGVFTLWGSSPGVATNTTLPSPPPGLGAGEYLTRVRWEYGTAQPGMSASTAPRIAGKIVNPDNAGIPVAFGETISSCADLSALYTAWPMTVTRSSCKVFALSGPFVQLNPAKETPSGNGPFVAGQSVAFRLRVRSDAASNDPIPLEDLVVADLLPAGLTFGTWTFDDRGTGLPAPQSFEQLPNHQGTGRTLLRWKWNAGSGSLTVNGEVWINLTTAVGASAPGGTLSNELDLYANDPALGSRCTGATAVDALDLDGDGSSTDIACAAVGTITINVVPVELFRFGAE